MLQDHVAIDRNPGPGYSKLLLRLIPGNILSGCPHRQFHRLPGLKNGRAGLPNPYPKRIEYQGGRQFVPFL